MIAMTQFGKAIQAEGFLHAWKAAVDAVIHFSSPRATGDLHDGFPRQRPSGDVREVALSINWSRELMIDKETSSTFEWMGQARRDEPVYTSVLQIQQGR
jgi:hypothetical protein